jgi:hypothetical protein
MRSAVIGLPWFHLAKRYTVTVLIANPAFYLVLLLLVLLGIGFRVGKFLAEIALPG